MVQNASFKGKNMINIDKTSKFGISMPGGFQTGVSNGNQIL